MSTPEERTFTNPWDITTVDSNVGAFYRVKVYSGIDSRYESFPTDRFEIVVTFKPKPVDDADEPA